MAIGVHQTTVLHWRRDVLELPPAVPSGGQDKLSPDDQAFLRDRLAAGWAVKRVARALGVDPATVRNWRRRLGLTAPRPEPRPA